MIKLKTLSPWVFSIILIAHTAHAQSTLQPVSQLDSLSSGARYGLINIQSVLPMVTPRDEPKEITVYSPYTHPSRADSTRSLQTHLRSHRHPAIPNKKTLFMALSDSLLSESGNGYDWRRDIIRVSSALALEVSYEIFTHFLEEQAVRFTHSSLFGEVLGGAMGGILLVGVEWMSTGQLNPDHMLEHAAYTLGSALGTYGIFGLVASYGVAGTGTSISALSGAAATKATLAWLGGGTIASGGGGMAVGSVVLSGMTLGVGTLIAIGTKASFEMWKAKERSDFQIGVLHHIIHSI